MEEKYSEFSGMTRKFLRIGKDLGKSSNFVSPQKYTNNTSVKCNNKTETSRRSALNKIGNQEVRVTKSPHLTSVISGANTGVLPQIDGYVDK